jgi:dipeptide/tripeptide permease
MKDDGESRHRSMYRRVADGLRTRGHVWFGLMVIAAGLGYAVLAPILLVRAGSGIGDVAVSVVMGLIVASTGPTCMKHRGIAASGAGVLLLAVALVVWFLASTSGQMGRWGMVATYVVSGGLLGAGVVLVIRGMRSSGPGDCAREKGRAECSDGD